jgi:hypothetical protein
MQDVPLSPGSTIHAGATVIGRLIAVQPANGGSGGKVSFRFDTLLVSKQRIPVSTNLRAVGIDDGSKGSTTS